jgi:hypothetical protein
MLAELSKAVRHPPCRERNKAQRPDRKPMREKHDDLIMEDEEPMEAPAPHQIGHRKKFEAFERDITGGHHIGHLPVYVDELEGWTLRRCRCGFSLALTPSGAIWWLRTTKAVKQLDSFKALLRALNSNCWAHPRPGPVKQAAITAPAAAVVEAESPEPPASDPAINAAPPPASLATPSEPQAASKGVTAPMPPVEKPPPAKRRKTYVPDNTMRTTRARRNPPGR